MKMNNFKCIESLEENPVEVFLEVTAILLKLVDNVLLYPSNPKYRKLRLENKLVSTVIMPSIGAMECLFELGFQEDDDALLLPPESTSMEKLTCFRTEVSNRRNKYLKKSGGSSSDKLSETQPIVSVERQSTPQPEAASQPQSSVVKSTTTSVNQLLASLHAWSTRVLQYEQEDTKLKALSVVPLSDISERVQSRMRLYQQQAMKDGQPLNESSIQETVFFMELMDWFKNDFFTWVNSPKCPTCDCDTQFLEMSSSPKEMVHSDRVEVYKCGKCAAKVLFPRINDPSKLLDTRRGRCGEWANAFTALCRALGWDARFVLDLTDHVWTEVYFKSEGRWVHCDPCECALDKPLLYEKGWGKNLTYIVAFSCEDVQDVTWRYSANHSAVLARRNLCTEQQLLQTIRDLNQIRQANLSTLRKKVLAKRTLVELVQLMFPAAGSEGDDQGRQSGSLAWRLARSEASLAQADNRACVWTPTSQEVEAKKMVVSYCSGTDEYSRGLSGDKIKGWRAGVFSAENMWRKEEKDWKMAYLCRTESSTEGRVSWKIDLSSCGLEVDQVDVLCLSTTFHSGKVTWLLCSGDKCIRITDGKLKTSELRGSTNLTLSASLSGGEGSVSWQHAQLFRQKVDAADASFYLCVTFTKLNKC